MTADEFHETTGRRIRAHLGELYVQRAEATRLVAKLDTLIAEGEVNLAKVSELATAWSKIATRHTDRPTAVAPKPTEQQEWEAAQTNGHHESPTTP